MAIGPVSAPRLSELVYRGLVAAILDGSVGTALPSERELAGRFAVNRHAVREAIKRLEQARLVEVTQGGATRLLGIAEHARLDVVPDLLEHGSGLDLGLVGGVLEMRASLGADAARRCAERSPGVGRSLAGLVPRPDASPGGLHQANRAYWTAIVEGAQNLSYRLALNTLVAGLDTLASRYPDHELFRALLEEYARRDTMAALAGAITAGDGPGAAEITRGLLEPIAAGVRR